MSDIKISSTSYVDEVGNFFMDVTFREGDTVIEKRIPLKDYILLFQKNMEEKENYVHIPRLPGEVVWAEVSSLRDDTFRAALFYPSGRRFLDYQGIFMELPYPAMFAVVEVKKGVRVDTRLFAAVCDTYEENIKLYHFPFGNVYSDGRCCFGNVVCRDIAGVSQAPVILKKYLNATTNDDLWAQAKRCKGFATQKEWVAYLKTCETFPFEVLQECEKTPRRVLAEFKN